MLSRLSYFSTSMNEFLIFAFYPILAEKKEEPKEEEEEDEDMGFGLFD